MPKNNGDGFDEKNKTVPIVVVAAFTLSIRTNLKIEVLLVTLKCSYSYCNGFSTKQQSIEFLKLSAECQNIIGSCVIMAK